MLDQFKVCYHGTTTIQQIKMMQSQGIQLEYSAKATDFGQGFYVTTNYEQAKSWAQRKAMKERSEYLLENQITDQVSVDDMIQPVILKYKLSLSSLKQLKGQVFNSPNEGWADFILENRTVPLPYTQIAYDYAVGPVADGNVFRIMLNLQHGRINKSEFHAAIHPKGQMKAYNQLSLNSLKSVQCLYYRGSDLI